MNTESQQSLISIFETMCMQNEAAIEMDIWNYLDGACDKVEQARISILIEKDEVWQKKYAEINVLHQQLNQELETEHPSLRFTQNIMEAVANEKIAPAAKAYLNKWVLTAIIVFFAISLGVIFYYAVTDTITTGSSSRIRTYINPPDFHFPLVSDTKVIYGFILLNIIAGLLLLDTLIKRKRFLHIK